MTDIAASIPGTCADGPLFRAPWQARIFALIVASVQAGHLPWADFQTRLAAEITEMERTAPAGGVETAYFDCWLRAAEDTLRAADMIADGDIAAQIDTLRATIADIRAAQTFT